MISLLAQVSVNTPAVEIVRIIAVVLGATCLWTLCMTFLEAVIAGSVEKWEIEDLQATPKRLHDGTYSKLNWFGSWFIVILIRILNPVMTVWFTIRWCFTVKRSEKES